MSMGSAVKSVVRPVVGERGWAVLRRAKRRVVGPPPKTPKQPKGPMKTEPEKAAGLILEKHPKDSHKMSRHQLLKTLHAELEPRTYLETGVATGTSLALARCRSIGIDPAFVIDHEIHCDVSLHRVGSDDFFAREDALSHFGGDPIDLAFIDGMHLFEYALRDFMNVERNAGPHTVAVIDDMLPRTSLEAHRDRKTRFWTGDVFWIAPVLTKYRPDLIFRQVDTRPTGVVVIMGLDPTNNVLWDNYDEIIRDFIRPDPQKVPAEILTRANAVKPEDLLAHQVWRDLVALRSADGSVADRLATLNAAAATLPVGGQQPA
jgi:hypothetical protein